MSWTEYNDMWLKAQESGNYLLFVFDLKDSKKINSFKNNLHLLLFSIYSKIETLEKIYDIKILRKNTIFNNGDRGDLMEPFLFMGDLFGFTILRNTLTPNDIYSIFVSIKEELNIDYLFHFSNGYYETDLYDERNEKYFRGYCLQYLEDRCKKNKNLI